MKIGKLYIIVVCFIIIMCGCKSKARIEPATTQNSRFRMVVEDYYKRNKKEIEEFDIFSVDNPPLTDKGYYFYRVLPVEANYNYVIDIDESLSYLPSDYIEYQGKLFFREEGYGVKADPNMLEFLNSLKLLDSIRVKLQLGILNEENAPVIFDRTDDSKEAVKYFICKDKPYKIKKRIKSSVYLDPADKQYNNICD